MAFEPQLNEIETKYNKRLDVIKTQSSITLNANGEKIEKVLFARVLPSVTNISLNSGNVNLEGSVSATALVVTESGVSSLTGQGNFTASYNSSLINAESQIFANAQNLGIENISVSDLTVSLTSMIGLELIKVEKQKIGYVTSIAPANEKIDTLNYSTITNAVSENFEISTEIDLPNSVSKVLLAESFGVLKDVVSANDVVTLGGEIYTSLVYLTSDENPKLKKEIYSTDFHQEVLMTGVTSGQKAFANLNTCCNDFEIQGELTSSKGVVALKNKFSANVFVEKTETVDAVIDAFCPRKELEMNVQSFTKQEVVCSKIVTDKIDGNIVLGEDDVRIDKVLISSSGLAVVNSTQIVDNDVVVQGTAFVNVIYLLDDEARTTEAVQVEIPFESNVRCDDLKSDDIVMASVTLKDTEARNKKSKEIDVLADAVISVVVIRNENEAVLSDIKIGENRKPPEANMGLYVVESAEDSWEVAKSLLVSPAMLMEQNPELSFPITKPTEILVYHQQRIE